MSPAFGILARMRGWMLATTTTLVGLSCFLTGCGGGGVSENHQNRGLNPGVGPFDSRGNYVESWADDKSKGRAWRASRVVGAPQMAAAEPSNPPPVVASHVTPAPKPSSQVSRGKSKPVAPVRGVTTPSKKSRVASRPQSKPKPKSVAKPKPKKKSPIRYTIKKGDTLYALSRKYKTSVSSIQRANGLKGTNLRIGRTLLIPRY